MDTKTKQQHLATWFKWGKDEFKIVRRQVLNDKRFYDTEEKIKKYYDAYGNSWMLKDEHDERLITKFGYDTDFIPECKEQYKKGFDSSRKWYEKADKKYKQILEKYEPIFQEANEVAKNVDVSDIYDGFPCGSAHLYLDDYLEVADLRKALAHFSTYDSDCYKYALPIQIPCHGQCVDFSDRICKEVQQFLRTKGIFALIYSMLD